MPLLHSLSVVETFILGYIRERSRVRSQYDLPTFDEIRSICLKYGASDLLIVDGLAALVDKEALIKLGGLRYRISISRRAPTVTLASADCLLLDDDGAAPAERSWRKAALGGGR